MLEHLLETGAQRRKSAWGGIVSVTVHTAIIGIVVVATAKATPAPKFAPADTTLVRLDPPPSDATGHDARGTTSATGATSTLPALPIVPTIDVPSTIEPTLPNTGIGAPGADSSLLSMIGPQLPNGSGAMDRTGAADNALVDSPIRALVDRTPRYPAMLRDAGVTGSVRVQFVVDTVGRVEPASIRILDSSHELFTRAVITALRGSRFTAGAVSGRRVRTLVERSFRFDIAGSAH